MRRAKPRTTRSGGWRQWKEDDARQALAELAASGEALAFSRRTGVSLARLAYWRRRVSLPEATPTSFVAVDLAGVGPRQLEIAAFGVVIRVREDLDADRVAHLVEAIGRRMVRAC